jgi:hypothetical protein
MDAPTDSNAAPAAPSSGVTPEQIQAQLKTELDATYIEIKDKSGELVSCPCSRRIGRRSKVALVCAVPLPKCRAASLGHNGRVTCHTF